MRLQSAKLLSLLLPFALVVMTGCSFEDSQNQQYGYDPTTPDGKEVARKTGDDTEDPGDVEKGAVTADFGEFDEHDPYGANDTSGYEKAMSKLLEVDEMDLQEVPDEYDWSKMIMKDPGDRDPVTDGLLSENPDDEDGYFSEKNKGNLPGKEAVQPESPGTIEEYVKKGKGTLDASSPQAGDPIKAMLGGGEGQTESSPDSPQTNGPRRGRRSRSRRKVVKRDAGPKQPKTALRKASKGGVPQILMKSGVSLPQLLPTGTGVAFSVDYHFTRLGPQKGTKYVWVIRSRSGKTMARAIPVRGAGRLQTVVPEFRPDDKPFTTMIMEVRPEGIKRQICKTYVFPTAQ